jgi:hypothetical protein
MNKKVVSTFILRWAKRIKAINLLGGKCVSCGDSNIFHLVFHHKDSSEKERNINLLKHYKWSVMLTELKKCELYCANCHKELHFMKDYKDCNTDVTIKRRSNKLILINYKDGKCEKCEYDKNQQSLVFHHVGDNKKFIFNGFSDDINIFELESYIKEELDKCILLCNNCHIEEHINKEMFYTYEKEIYDKVKNYKEKQSKLPIDKVISMYENGIKQISIAKHFNASKGTISGIIKNKHK